MLLSLSGAVASCVVFPWLAVPAAILCVPLYAVFCYSIRSTRALKRIEMAGTCAHVAFLPRDLHQWCVLIRIISLVSLQPEAHCTLIYLRLWEEFQVFEPSEKVMIS